jgi:deazaflavin-dependent oxidoreductase (nitroreductase family)
VSRYRDTKFRVITAFQRKWENPLFRRIPFQTLLETTGRKSGLPRHTPIGGRREGRVFWFVAAHGPRAHYVRNIEADPWVRVRYYGRWYTGTAHPVPDDDPVARLRTLPRFNGVAVRALKTELMTMRVDLTSREARRWSFTPTGNGR